jgi:hypothetical protein
MPVIHLRHWAALQRKPARLPTHSLPCRFPLSIKASNRHINTATHQRIKTSPLQSDYNPMEEPSWMHPLESPLVADASATPTSALTGGGGGGADAMPEVTQLAGALAMAGQEAHSRAAEADDLPEQGAAAVVAVGGAEAVPTSSAALPAEAVMAAAPDEPALPPAAASVAAPMPAEFGEQPPADHLVWTNEDGDIDALPWDMGGWSTGSSAQREGSNGGCGDEEEACALPALHGDKLDGGVQQQQPQQQQQQLAKQQGSKPAGEDALIGALRRKVRCGAALAPACRLPAHACSASDCVSTLHLHCSSHSATCFMLGDI